MSALLLADDANDDDEDGDGDGDGDALSTLLTCRPLRFEVASTSIFGPQGQSHWVKGGGAILL